MQHCVASTKKNHVSISLCDQWLCLTDYTTDFPPNHRFFTDFSPIQHRFRTDSSPMAFGGLLNYFYTGPHNLFCPRAIASGLCTHVCWSARPLDRQEPLLFRSTCLLQLGLSKGVSCSSMKTLSHRDCGQETRVQKARQWRLPGHGCVYDFSVKPPGSENYRR